MSDPHSDQALNHSAGRAGPIGSGSSGGESEDSTGWIGVGRIATAVRRHILLVGAVATFTTTFALIAFRQPELYRATAVLRLAGERRAVSAGLEQEVPTLDRHTVPLTSLVPRVRSRAVLGAVVDSLGLQLRPVPRVSMLRPPTQPRLGLVGVAVDPSSGVDTLRLTFGTEVTVQHGDSVRQASYGRPIRMGPAKFAVPAHPGVWQAVVAVIPRDIVIDRMRDQLAVVPLAGTDALEVRVIDTDPHRAQQMANQVVLTFFAFTVNSSQEQARRRRQFLEGQLQETERVLARVQGGLSAFRSRRQVGSSSAKLAQQQAELMGLDSRRGELQADRRVFSSLLTRLQTANDSARVDELRNLAYSPEIAADPIVGKVLQQILTYRTRVDSLTSGPWRSSATDPDVVQLSQLMRVSQDELVRAVGARVSSIDERIAAVANLRTASADHIATLPAMEAEEARLEQKVSALSDFANQLRLEFQKSRMSEELAAADIEIVDLASLPYLPTGIPWWLKVGVALMLGLLVGAVVAVLLELRNRSIRGPEELRRVLRLRELGVIPPVAEAVAAEKARSASERKRINPPTSRRPLQGVVLDAPWPSVGAEAFRLLYSSLTFNWGEGRRIILITSVAPQEGKTLVAANLAVTFAREGARVLLVDCDLRRPRLHKMFQVSRAPGLVQLLRPASAPALPEHAGGDDESRPSEHSYSMLPGVERLAGANGISTSGAGTPGDDRAGARSRNAVSLPSVRDTSVKGLSLLPSGTMPMNSAETLKAGPFRRFLNEVSEAYDVIVLDTPPVLASADAVILAPLADDVLLVLRAGQTHRDAAERAHQQLTDAGGHVLGAVLNDPEGEVGRDHKMYYEYDYPAAAD